MNDSGGDGGGADDEKLSSIYETLRKDLPLFFVSQMNYRNVHKDIVFENRIRGKTYTLVQKQLNSLQLHKNVENFIIISTNDQFILVLIFSAVL